MIKEYVEIWQSHQNEVKAKLEEKQPEEYQDIVKMVVKLIAKYDTGYDVMDTEKIHVIDDGDYQGTLLFLIPADSYQPSVYYYIFVDYGSCSGCDTLQSIRADCCYDNDEEGYDDDKPSKHQVKDYMALALHIVQSIKKIEG